MFLFVIYCLLSAADYSNLKNIRQARDLAVFGFWYWINEVHSDTMSCFTTSVHLLSQGGAFDFLDFFS